MRICLALLFIFFSNAAISSTQSWDYPIGNVLGRQSLESVNYPDHFIRHANYLGEITPISTALDRQDSTFVVVPSLNGRPGAVSIESTNYPGYFLRHQNFRLNLSRYDSTPLFNDDASFFVRPGLADPRGISLESVNYPGHFIRHSSFHLFLNPIDGSTLFRQDATFLLAAPNDIGRSQQTASCFWLEPGPAGVWRQMPQLATRYQCYEQDSCSGGLGRSGGGCYKWASGPYAPAERW